jgi:hypothetical protein
VRALKPVAKEVQSEPDIDEADTSNDMKWSEYNCETTDVAPPTTAGTE